MSATLGHSDAMGLSRAVGWLELGNAGEGLQELDQVSPEARQHPSVLEVRWLLLAKMGDWAKALPVAEQLLGLAPERPSGWMHKAYALRRVEGGGIEQASAVLREAAQRFPQNSLVAFNLACYACQMGREEEALEWLNRAFGSEDKGVLKSMALEDEDLRALWPRIQEL